jgi:hypothetical protein
MLGQSKGILDFLGQETWEAEMMEDTDGVRFVCRFLQ